jgi:hypothetical protein
MAALAPVDPVQAYIDWNPTSASVDAAIYQMQPGQLLVVWRDSVTTTGQIPRWQHTIEICVRAPRDKSTLDLIDLIVTGVPYPGDGLPWLRCPLLPYLYPTEVSRIGRATDTEGVDYGVIVTETAETGDWPLPS